MNTKAVELQIVLNGILRDILAKSSGENVTVTWNGTEMTLTNALANILTAITGKVTMEEVETKVNALIDGAPEAYNTFKEIADYITEHKEAADLLTAAINDKVDKETGKGLSTEDFTTALKTKLESMEPVTAAEKETWNNKAEKTVATTTAAGLMSAGDKTKLDNLRGVIVLAEGAEVPAGTPDGTLVVHTAAE